jgi:outer membrane protein OmpA-like peptidoglycan-associated protein
MAGTCPLALMKVPALADAAADASGGVVPDQGESPVRFEPNSTAFADPDAAVRALTPIARWLAVKSSRHAWLEGTTADVGPIRGQIALAKLRADRVRDEMIVLGAAAAQIGTRGVGSDLPQFVPDRNAAGILLAGPATLNRSVRITLG